MKLFLNWSANRAIHRIRNELWYFYDDIKCHKNEGKMKLGKETENVFRQIILFLKSDFEYRYSHPTFYARVKEIFKSLHDHSKQKEKVQEEIEFWPFLNRLEYELALTTPKYFKGSSTYFS